MKDPPAEIRKVFMQLNESRGISLSYLKILRERFSVTFSSFQRESKRLNKEYRRTYVLKKARTVYLDILGYDPHVLLPAMLVLSPNACLTFDALKCCKKLTGMGRLALDGDARSALEGIAREGEFTANIDYQKLMQALFLTGAPLSTAKPEDVFAFYVADLQSLPVVLGTHIMTAIEISPTRIVEKSAASSGSTQCIRARLPRFSMQDAMIWFDVGMDESVRALFPSENPPGQQYFECIPAYIPALSTTFSHRICAAIEACELWLWETKQQASSETTRCVTFQRVGPFHGVIYLRLQYVAACNMLNDLFSTF